MKLYVRVFAAFYDRALAASERAGLAGERRLLLAHARGSVLEIGAGTGLNLEHYPRGLDELVLTEPEEPMRRRLEDRVARDRRRARVVEATAEDLPFPDRSFDTVVSTLVLCSVANPRRALGELHRVLRPGGQLLLLEHVRAEDERLARWQDRLARPWRAFACGCRCNQRTADLVETARFALGDLEWSEVPKAPAIVRPLVRGRAAAI